MLNTPLFQNNRLFTGVRNFISSPFGSFLTTLITAVVGIALLIIFFSMILNPGLVLVLFPLIVAFNSCMSGFSIAEKNNISQRLQPPILISLAVLLTTAGCSFVTVLFPWEPLVDGSRFLTAGSMAIFFSLFGAWIAKRKNQYMKNSSIQPRRIT